MKSNKEFDLLEGIRKTKKEENPYLRFSLNSNPFPKSAIADVTSESFFSRCRKKALAKIKDFLVYTYSSRRWAGLILRGEYGSGKTHMLFYVINEVNKQLGTLDKRRTLAIYVENPKGSINELHQDVMEKLGRDNFESQVAAVIEERVKEVFESIPRQRLITAEEIPQDPLFRLRRTGKGVSTDRKNQAWDILSKKLLSDGLSQHRDFARCLGIVTIDEDQDTRNSAWRFLIGNALSKSEAKKLGLVSERLSEDEIIRYVFPSVIEILSRNGISMLILFVDEVEKIATKSSSFAFNFLENLRSLIDNNLNHFSMVFACVPEAWDVLASTSPGLSERMSEMVDLDPLDDSQAVLLVEDYLKNARIQPYSLSPLLPFDEATVKEMNRVSKGSMRYILQNCHIVLEHAVAKADIVKEIPIEFVRKILSG